MQAARGASLNPSDQTGTAVAATSRRRFLQLFAGLALTTYLVDLVTKIVAVEKLSDRPPVELVGEVFSLHLSRNPGAAFSTGTSYTLVLTCIAIVATLVVLHLARRLGSAGWAVALGFLLGGVLGNLTDRIFRSPAPLEGHVVDFLRFSNLPLIGDFPIFNFADIWINVAAGVIIVQAIRGIRVDGRRHDEVADGSPDESRDDSTGDSTGDPS